MSSVAPHLAQLGACARPAGSAAADAARRYCATVLREAGFTTSEQPFEYSQFGGRWAAPVAGLVIPLAASGLVLGARDGASARSLILAAIVAAILVAGLLRYVGGRGVLEAPLLRARGVNLQAVRGRGEPRVWLIAHIDSKWQPVSMLMRVAGVVIAAIGVAGVIVCTVAAKLGAEALVFAGVTWLGGIPLMVSVVGSENHGTLDNASGVAAVLTAAEKVPRHIAVGIMITDAEELALAGARAWARAGAPAIGLNCDSVDDNGRLALMYTGREPTRAIAAVRRAAVQSNEPVRVMRLPPGILTDSVALAQAGWHTVTLSRGDLRTLHRIHTRADSLAGMRGTGIPVAADVLARAASELAR